MIIELQPVLYGVRVCFFFNDTATTEIYTLSLHDALPISVTTTMASNGRSVSDAAAGGAGMASKARVSASARMARCMVDRKSTRLNSSHAQYLVCRLLLEKKKIS